MRLILYGVACASIAVGFVHASMALPGTRRETEGALLLLCGLLCGGLAFLLGRLRTKKCHGCGERIGVESDRCGCCGTPVAASSGRHFEA
jgi:hypothetical protein